MITQPHFSRVDPTNAQKTFLRSVKLQSNPIISNRISTKKRNRKENLIIKRESEPKQKDFF